MRVYNLILVSKPVKNGVGYKDERLIYADVRTENKTAYDAIVLDYSFRESRWNAIDHFLKMGRIAQAPDGNFILRSDYLRRYNKRYHEIDV